MKCSQKILNHTLDTWLLRHDYFSCKCATRAHSANSEIKNRDASVDFGSRCGLAAWLVAAAAQSDAASEVPLLENVERRARRLLAFYAREEGSLFHFHDSSTARRAAGSRSSSVSARARQRRCPWPLSQSSPYFVEANSARHNTRRFYTSSRQDGGETRVTCPRAYTRTRVRTTHHPRGDARKHAVPRRRGRRRRARSSDRIVEGNKYPADPARQIALVNLVVRTRRR